MLVFFGTSGDIGDLKQLMTGQGSPGPRWHARREKGTAYPLST